jgi:hypothetical protein
MIQADNASVLLVFSYLSVCSVPESYSPAHPKEAEATLIEKRQFYKSTESMPTIFRPFFGNFFHFQWFNLWRRYFAFKQRDLMLDG